MIAVTEIVTASLPLHPFSPDHQPLLPFVSPPSHLSPSLLPLRELAALPPLPHAAVLGDPFLSPVLHANTLRSSEAIMQ